MHWACPTPQASHAATRAEATQEWRKSGARAAQERCWLPGTGCVLTGPLRGHPHAPKSCFAALLLFVVRLAPCRLPSSDLGSHAGRSRHSLLSPAGIPRSSGFSSPGLPSPLCIPRDLMSRACKQSASDRVQPAVASSTSNLARKRGHHSALGHSLHRFHSIASACVAEKDWLGIGCLTRTNENERVNDAVCVSLQYDIRDRPHCTTGRLDSSLLYQSCVQLYVMGIDWGQG